MRRALPQAMLLFALIFLPIPYGVAARLLALPDAGDGLTQLNFASFSGSGQNSIQAIATDSSGNVFVAGTTTSPDLPVKNAAQPNFGESRVMRTTDLGASWTRVGNPPEDVSAVVVDPVIPQVLFAGGDTGIYKSSDGGGTWRLVYQFSSRSSSTTSALVIDPGNHLRLAALAPFSGALILSLDGGETWANGGLTCPISSCGGRLLADPTGSGALLVNSFDLRISRDWGLTFQQIRPLGGSPLSAAFEPSHPGWIYAGTAAGVLGTLSLSTDFGASWTVKASPPTTFSGILNLAVDPDQPGTLVATTADGLYTSSDDAASWRRQTASGHTFLIEGNFPFALLSHTCARAGGLFALGSGAAATFQVSFSPDYGATWMTPQLTKVNSVTAGPGCAVYITRQASSDAFIAKIAPDGTQLWSTFLGGSDQDVTVDLAVDAQGNAYLTGNTTSPDFPLTVPRIGVPGQSGVFIARFSAEGKLEYSALVSGESSNTALAIEVDRSQNVYVAGVTNSLKFPITPGVLVSKMDSQSYTGFLLKLSPAADLVYATYLGESYTFPGAMLVVAEEQVIIAGSGAVPGLPVPSIGTSPQFVLKLDRTASQIISSTYIPGTSSPLRRSGLATDAEGNLFVYGAAGPNFSATPGAYTSPQSPSTCAEAGIFFSFAGDAYVMKLGAADWQPIYSALLRAPCGIQPGAIAVDGSGAVVLALATGGGLPLRSPLLAGPTCSVNSSAVAKIIRDGSALEFASYLDNCGVPGLALAPDGSLYAGGSPSQAGHSAGVLHLSPTTTQAVSLDQISNAFSGDARAVAGGGLYSLTGSGFEAPLIDLGLNSDQDLPTELGGIQVKFDGVAAAILQTSPGRVIVVPPAELPASHASLTPGLTAVQLFTNEVPSQIVWMPVSKSLPGLLTRDFPDLAPHPDLPDGNVRNADGTLNDADHPAAAGSTITLFATGLGATNPPVAPGSIARSTTVVPVTQVYASWQRFSFEGTPPEPTYSVPRFVSSLFQVLVQVPNSIENLGGTTLSNGVRRVLVALQFTLSPSSRTPLASNLVAVYVK